MKEKELQEIISKLKTEKYASQVSIAALTEKHRQSINEFCKLKKLDTIVICGKRLIIVNDKLTSFLEKVLLNNK